MLSFIILTVVLNPLNSHMFRGLKLNEKQLININKNHLKFVE